MLNKKVAQMLNRIADDLDIQGVPYKPRAYRRAARSIEALMEPIEDLHAENRLTEIDGVGKSIGKKIAEIIETGDLEYIGRIEKEIPPGLREMLAIPFVGPKTVKKLYDELGVDSIQAVEEAAEKGRIHDLEGFGVRSEAKILHGARMVYRISGRRLLGILHPIAHEYLRFIEQIEGVERTAMAGSLRRMRSTIGDIDLLAAADDSGPIMEAFAGYRDVDEIIVKGDTKSSVRLQSGIQVDLRVIKPESWGAALQYFTGSVDHNVRVRREALARGYTLNEYALTIKEGDNAGDVVHSETEEGIYKALDMVWIPPELREARGEVDAALKDELPNLLTLDDIRGDLHLHTMWSDGRETVKSLMEKATEKGYEYIGITDHSESLKIANGVPAADLEDHINKARDTADDFPDITLFFGSEVDILRDGSLDYDDATLELLDHRICGIHTIFGMPEEEMTARVCTAMETGMVDILAHPTGILLGKRDPLNIDIQKVIEVAAETNTALEINSFPDRLDLNSENARAAINAGVMLAIDTDSHLTDHMEFMMYGVATARRGWAEKENVLNTRSADNVAAWIKGRR